MRRLPDDLGVVYAIDGPPPLVVEIVPVERERCKVRFDPRLSMPVKELPIRSLVLWRQWLDNVLPLSYHAVDGSSLVRSSLPTDSMPTCTVQMLLQSIVLWHRETLEPLQRLGPEEMAVLEVL